METKSYDVTDIEECSLQKLIGNAADLFPSSRVRLILEISPSRKVFLISAERTIEPADSHPEH